MTKVKPAVMPKSVQEEMRSSYTRSGMNEAQKRYAMTRIKEIADNKNHAEQRISINKKYITDQQRHSALKHKQAKLLPLEKVNSNRSYLDAWFEFPEQKKLEKEYNDALRERNNRLEAIKKERQRLNDLIQLGNVTNEKILSEIKRFEELKSAQ